jgi:hypothetical protein
MQNFQPVCVHCEQGRQAQADQFMIVNDQ